MNGMENRKTKNNERGLLPYSIIVAANLGEAESIRLVLQHYNRYITSLSLNKFQDEYENRYQMIDTEMQGRLQTKLIQSILAFKI